MPPTSCGPIEVRDGVAHGKGKVLPSDGQRGFPDRDVHIKRIGGISTVVSRGICSHRDSSSPTDYAAGTIDLENFRIV